MRNLQNTIISKFIPYIGKDGQYHMSTNPVSVSLFDALQDDSQKELLKELRLFQYKCPEQSELKRQLVAITPSSLQEHGRGEKYHKQHSGFIQFDIDGVKESDRASMFSLLTSIPYTSYCALSASGNGYWGLFPIANPEKHTQHFDAMELAFKEWKISIDTKPRNLASLRFLSYDENAYFNSGAKVFDKIVTPKNISQKPLQKSNQAQDNPWVNFNSNADFDIVHTILLNAGWQYHHTQGEKVRYTRPDKDTRAGISADYHTGLRTFYVFSDQAPSASYFIKKNGGSASDVLLHYAAYGDSKQAYKLLRELGY
ncbi:MAG TPA: hypothetical protein DCG77_12185 [Sphingobacterium sp.]|nr:hypothetical protein [Sphingobacterium sp.]